MAFVNVPHVCWKFCNFILRP